MTNSIDPDGTAILTHLIGIYTACKGVWFDLHTLTHMPNGLFCHTPLDRFISNLRSVWFLLVLLLSIEIPVLNVNYVDPDQTPRKVIMKTRLYNLDPLKPHFYIVKLGLTGVYTIFLISAQNIDCGYSLEPPRRGGSNEYPQSIFWAEIRKISNFFYLKILFFLVVKFSIYLNRRVFVKCKAGVWSGSTLFASVRFIWR